MRAAAHKDRIPVPAHIRDAVLVRLGASRVKAAQSLGVALVTFDDLVCPGGTVRAEVLERVVRRLEVENG